jgi:hypothetical protein
MLDNLHYTYTRFRAKAATPERCELAFTHFQQLSHENVDQFHVPPSKIGEYRPVSVYIGLPLLARAVLAAHKALFRHKTNSLKGIPL